MYLVKNSFKEFEINGKQAFKHIYLLESEEQNETNFIDEIQKFRDKQIKFFLGDFKLEEVRDEYKIQNGLAILKITYVYE